MRLLLTSLLLLLPSLASADVLFAWLAVSRTVISSGRSTCPRAEQRRGVATARQDLDCGEGV